MGQELIPTGKTLTYDIYINSSGRPGVEHFVKIWKKGRALSGDRLKQIQEKFGHIYVLEDERGSFLSCVGDASSLSKTEKSQVLKDAAVNYLKNIFQSEHQFSTRVLEETFRGCHGAVIGMLDVIKDSDILSLQDLIGELNYHDHYTYDHSIDSGIYNIAIMKTINPNAKNEELVLAGLCGMFHDIGKVRLPNNIINATHGLTDEDYNMIKKHPHWGADLIQGRNIHIENGVNIPMIATVILQHHENFNGSGYPYGIAGNQINVFARMTAIADFFDAITTKRSYHEPLEPLDALKVMANSRGKKLDPVLFDAFALRVRGYEKGKDYSIFLPDTFDPCQPHNHLPFQIGDRPTRDHAESKVYGKVIVKG